MFTAGRDGHHGEAVASSCRPPAYRGRGRASLGRDACANAWGGRPPQEVQEVRSGILLFVRDMRGADVTQCVACDTAAAECGSVRAHADA